MKYAALLIALLGLAWPGLCFAEGDQPQKRASLKSSDKTRVTIEGRTVTVTFKPVDLPVAHSDHSAGGHSAANKRRYSFDLPEDMYLVGYKAAAYTKDGTPLPKPFLHHIIMLNNDKESVSCPGKPLLFAGAGGEMTEARFPDGYGVKLGKGQKLTAMVMYHHKAPPTKGVTVSFTMEMAPKGAAVQPMEVYLVGVNVVCPAQFQMKKAKNESGHGVLIKPCLNVRSVPTKFNMEGCTKFAYPHGHDQLILITLDNKTTGKTLLRTVPQVTPDGGIKAFPQDQVYNDPVGFSVNTQDDYEVTMVYHKPLDDKREQRGMGTYVMYMTPGPCPQDGLASAR